jgi:hypothetical protein
MATGGDGRRRRDGIRRRWQRHNGDGATGDEVDNDGNGMMSDDDDGDGATGDKVEEDGDRSRCCVAPPDGKRGCGTGDLHDNGGSDDNSPSSSSSYEDDDADIRRRGPGGGARCDPDQLIKNT